MVRRRCVVCTLYVFAVDRVTAAGETKYIYRNYIKCHFIATVALTAEWNYLYFVYSMYGPLLLLSSLATGVVASAAFHRHSPQSWNLDKSISQFWITDIELEYFFGSFIRTLGTNKAYERRLMARTDVPSSISNGEYVLTWMVSQCTYMRQHFNYERAPVLHIRAHTQSATHTQQWLHFIRNDWRRERKLLYVNSSRERISFSFIISNWIKPNSKI